MNHKNNDTTFIMRNDQKYANDPIAIAETVQSKIKLSNKSFISYLLTKIMNVS